MATMENIPGRPALEALVASSGMILFASFVQCPCFPAWVPAFGLFAAALAVAYSLHSAPCPAEVLGVSILSRRVAVCLLIGSAGGAALGMWSRTSQDLGALPSGIGGFVFAAAAIGASEELLFRGYIQGRLHRLGPVAATVLAAAAHAAYKVSLFLFMPEGMTVDYVWLAFCTFVVGAAAGALREGSGSVLPPVAGHVLFDIVLYGERSLAPWWVWAH